MSTLLSVADLVTAIDDGERQYEVVRGVSFDLAPGETLGVVGESGSGKTMTAQSLVRLLPTAAKIVSGRVLLGDLDLVSVPPAALTRIRGARIAMVFQDSMSALNPLLTIGRQMTEGLEFHRGMNHGEAERRALELLDEVGIPDPARRLGQFPHQLSGGLRQRVAIAIALAPDPDVLIADEPTTALDVTIQAQILDLLRREQSERGMGLILITHNLGVVARLTDRMAVMYAGRIVESGPTGRLLRDPAHPYTAGLIRSIPRLDGDLTSRLPSIGGTPPEPAERPTGCPFHPRCSRATHACSDVEPTLVPVGSSAHHVSCWHPLEGES